MSIRNVKRWQWILISLIIGAGFGYFNHLPTSDWRNAFGETLTPQQFEEGLSREQSGLKWLRNLVIYPEYIEDHGKRVRLLIVSGEYFDGRLEDQNGKRVAVWKPRCFIAEGPFEPITPNAGTKAGGSVIDFLNTVKDIRFAYAWWRDPAWAIGLWTGGSFVLIGLIWPTLINLIAFGSLRRPKEEKGIDLSKVSSGTSRDISAKAVDLEAAAKMAAELEAKLAAEAAAPLQPKKIENVPCVPVLKSAALELSDEQRRASKEFGKEQDDFYPTERHAPPHSDAEKSG